MRPPLCWWEPGELESVWHGKSKHTVAQWLFHCSRDRSQLGSLFSAFPQRKQSSLRFETVGYLEPEGVVLYQAIRKSSWATSCCIHISLMARAFWHQADTWTTIV